MIKPRIDLASRNLNESLVLVHSTITVKLPDPTPDTLQWIVQDGLVTWMSQSAMLALGSIVGQDPIAVVALKHQDRSRDARKRALAGEVTPLRPNRYIGVDGKAIHVMVNSRPFRWNDRPATMVEARLRPHVLQAVTPPPRYPIVIYR